MIDELANRADWDTASQHGYKGSYAEWQHDREDWMEFRRQFLAGLTGTDNFYIWRENKKNARDFDLSYGAAKEMGFTGTRDQWAKFINTMRGPSAYEIWMMNNAENIQDIFGKETISEKEWSNLLFSAEYMTNVAATQVDKIVHAMTEDEMDALINEVIAEKEG